MEFTKRMKDTKATILSLRSQGWSSHRIANLLNLTTKTIDDVVKGTSIGLRPSTESLMEEAVRLRLQGLRIRQISDAIGVPIGTVGAWLSHAGVLVCDSKENSGEGQQ